MPNRTFDYGDLRVTLTSEYEWAWSDKGTGCKYAITIYNPKPQGNLCPLGSVGIANYDDINGKRATLLVGPAPGASSAAVKRPTGYTSVWTDKGTGGNYDCTIWRPIAPDGYRSMGDIALNSYSAPSLDRVWCLRNDLTKYAAYGASDFWNDTKSGGAYDCSCWYINPEPLGVNGAEKLPISGDTFRAHQAYNRPDSSLCYVPLLQVKNEFKRFDAQVPKLNPSNIPATGDQLQHMVQCRVTLPFIAFQKPNDDRSLARIADPFWSVSRSIAWHVEGVWVNNGSGDFSREKKIKYGVSKTQSDEMTHSAGISVSASGGIGVVETSVTLNYQFTATSSQTFTEYTEQEVTEKFDVPSKTATVLFSKHVWLKAARGDESDILCQIEMAANDDIHFSGCPLT